MPLDPRIDHLHRLQRERRMRAAGRYRGTQVTTYGDVVGSPAQRDRGRQLLALLLMALCIGVVLTIFLYEQSMVLGLLHELLHALGFDHSGPATHFSARVK